MNFKSSIMVTLLTVASGLTHASVIVSELASSPSTTAWAVTNAQQGGATSELVSLVGEGGNLENNAPLPNGALKLTTGLSNNDRAEVGLAGDFGLVSDILTSTTTFSYDYFRTNVDGGNTFAAPALKLGFFNGGCAQGADCFFQLIYEPYQTPNSALVDGDWTSVDIDFANGSFWTTGGFGIANGAGGPPLYTIEELLDTANGDFAGATLFSIAFGLGTFNQGVTGYVDNFSYTLGQYTASFDFEAAEVSAPSVIGLFGLTLMGFGLVRRKS